MKTCTKCKEEKDFACFYRNKRRKDGHASECKQCSDLMNKTVRDKNKQQYYGYRNRWKQDLTTRINEWKSEQGCRYCSEREACCLELHHLDPTQKENHPSLMRTSWDRFITEAEKCIVVCSNCHKKIHAGLIKDT